jgi:6,7-dimethyl-8-ribityllumazine synthase
MVELNKAKAGDLAFDPSWKLGVVVSRFNERITERLKDGCAAELKELGVPDSAVTWVSVPGAYEIPLATKQLLENGRDGVITLGAVIRGDTTHYDYVCGAVDRGVLQLMLEYNRPVIFGILTTENFQQAWDRAGGSAGHKGIESAHVLLEMLNLQKTFSNERKSK